MYGSTSKYFIIIERQNTDFGLEIFQNYQHLEIYYKFPLSVPKSAYFNPKMDVYKLNIISDFEKKESKNAKHEC